VPYRVLVTSGAHREALDVAAFVAEHGSPEAALRWIDGLEAAIASLSEMPRRCGLAREHGAIAGHEIRQLVYGAYRLIFTIRGDELLVLHVRHAARREIDP